jgi:lysophospholipase L1-like esterase
MQYSLSNRLGKFSGGLDPAASAYISLVQAADGIPLESSIKKAINNFVKGCKSDSSPNAGVSNWDAIKSCCLLSGPRSLNGALVPLKGTAPTNVGFIGAGTDYARATGAVGNGTTKYLNSNRPNNADPQNNNHNSVYITNAVTGVISAYIGAGATGSGANTISQNAINATLRSRFATSLILGQPHQSGFVGHSRNVGTSYSYRFRSSSGTQNDASQTPNDNRVFVFARSNGATAEIPTASSIGFYSIGEAVDLVKLESRVNSYFSEINAVLSPPQPSTPSAYILGSSTAVGVGATSGNSWASKFSTYYASTGTTTNIAVSGTTVANASPTGYTIPTGWNDQPDPLKNITFAANAGADLVLINFPSNFINQTNGTTANYMTVLSSIVNLCVNLGIDYRVFTTQPRNTDSTKRQILKDTADAIISTYGAKVVNTFAELADPATLEIKPTYNAGDGVHINNAGHLYLYNQLIATL